MRAIFITLICANIAIFGWFQYQSTQDNNPANSPVAVEGVSIGNLVLSPVNQPGAPVVAAAEVVVPDVCLQLGGFDTQSDATQVQARLEALDIASTINVRKKQIVKNYGVYLEPYPNFQDAKNELAALNLKGVESFIYTEGDLKNGLSLGVYGKRENASSIFKKVEDLGYSPRIRETYQDVNTYFVILNAEGTSYFNLGIMDPIKTRYPQVESQKIDC